MIQLYVKIVLFCVVLGFELMTSPSRAHNRQFSPMTRSFLPGDANILFLYNQWDQMLELKAAQVSPKLAHKEARAVFL